MKKKVIEVFAEFDDEGDIVLSWVLGDAIQTHTLIGLLEDVKLSILEDNKKVDNTYEKDTN